MLGASCGRLTSSQLSSVSSLCCSTSFPQCDLPGSYLTSTHTPLTFCPGFSDLRYLSVQPGCEGALIPQGAASDQGGMEPVGGCSSVFHMDDTEAHSTWFPSTLDHPHPWSTVVIQLEDSPLSQLSLLPCFSLLSFPLLFPQTSYQNRLHAFRGTQVKTVPKPACFHLAVYFCAVQGRISMLTDYDLYGRNLSEYL